jgi:DNA polymerase III subunit gamma/tau
LNDATTPGNAQHSGAERPGAGRSGAEGFGLDQRTGPAAVYRVLARKYRPQTFDDLIGQGAMVRTLTNAFASGRIPQAWILTGVRGVGKTTTARILARALNYALKDGSITGPTITMPGLGLHCQAIIESRHVDVIEMDAASHNGVDDIRQINDAVRYAPVSARYKVYILDEVHMLSGAAFNALLKTLEEPPPHVKFVFATTEIRKVPVTVLSRCQRFDLRRVETATLVTHLETICAKEGIAAEREALGLVARAAEGSVRDALSLLDQAIAHAGASEAGASGTDASNMAAVRAEDLRQMLGLADRTQIIDLFEALMRGDVAAALTGLRDQYDCGADPAVVLADLAEFTNFVTRVKVVPSVADDVSLAETERTRGRAFATTLSMRVLSRTWQMLFKGLPEVQSAAKPIAAAEMVLVRIAYAADLPAPDEVIRSLINDDRPAAASGTGGGSASAAAPSASALRPVPSAARSSAAPAREPIAHTELNAGAAPGREAVARELNASAVPARETAARVAEPSPGPAPAPLAVGRFEDLIALAAEKRDLVIKTALERDVRLVRFEDGKLELALEPGAAKTLTGELSRKLSQWTGRRWMVVISTEAGAPTVKAQTEAQRAELLRGVAADPLVQAVLNRFPGAQIVGVRSAEPAPPAGIAGGPSLPDPAIEHDAFGGDEPSDDDP